jgi:hypothetical protein
MIASADDDDFRFLHSVLAEGRSNWKQLEATGSK